MSGVDAGLWLKVLGDILLVSIPEELFIVMLTLLLLGKFDFLQSEDRECRKFRLSDAVRLFTIVLTIAILSNILRNLNVDANVVLFTCTIGIFLMILFIYKMYWDWGEILKTFLFTVFSIIIFAAIEFSYAPMLFYACNMTVEDLNDSLFLKVLWTIPERVMQCLLLVFIIVKKATFLKARLVKIILQNRILTILTLISFLFNLAVLSLLEKIIWFDKILDKFTIAVQIAVSVAVLVFPVLNISVLLFVIYYITNREYEARFLAKQDMKIAVDDIKMFAKNGKSDKILNIVDILERDVSKLYKDM